MKWFDIDLRWAYGDLLGSIYRQTRSLDQAYDVLHDSLVHLAVACGRGTVRNHNAYLKKVVRSVLADQRRISGRTLSFPWDDDISADDSHPDVIETQRLLGEAGHLASAMPSPEHLTYLRERLRALQRILDCLPPRCRDVFLLFHLEGLTTVEIGRKLGVSHQAVGYHLRRALVDLAALVAEPTGIGDIDEQAANWFMVMRRAEPEDRRRFEAWLSADPAHRKAYDAQIKLAGRFESAAGTNEVAEALGRRAKAVRQERRAFLKQGLLGLLFAGGVGGLLYQRWRLQALWQAAFHTGVGEIARQMLADGSSLVLGADTSLRAAFGRAERNIWLDRGEVAFDVARDESRPFVIDGGLVRITVLGTRFAVNRLADKVRVSVDHGRVELKSGQFWRRRTLVLEDGQIAEIAAEDGLALPPRRVEGDAANAFAFEQGTIIFHNASLSEIAETLSRYRTKPIRTGPGAADVAPFNATAQRSDIEAFLRALPKIVPVTVTEEPGRTILGAHR